jgi:hypothetical protein
MGIRFRALSCLGLWCCAAAMAAHAADSAANESVTFNRRAPAKGDVARQSVFTNTKMHVSVHLAQQLVHENTTVVQRAQERTIHLTHVEPDVRMAGEVTYHEAGQSEASGSEEAASIHLPVRDKTYRVERQGDELEILDQDGLVPPLDEYEIVWQSMESFGKPNPLSDFLDGRTVALGETLELPTEAAVHLLAFGDDVVAVERFSLALQEVQPAGGSRRALFQVFVSSRTHGRSQMGMQVEGTLAVDAETCRVVALNLAGPIGMTEAQTHGPDTYLVSGRGKVQIKMQGAYSQSR